MINMQELRRYYRNRTGTILRIYMLGISISYLLLHSKLPQNPATSDGKHLVFHRVSEGQESGAGVSAQGLCWGCRYLGAFCDWRICFPAA